MPMPHSNVMCLAVAVCGLTTACGGAMAPTESGTYKGVAQSVVARHPSCPVARSGTVIIGDNRLIFPYLPDTVFIAPLRPDGTLVAQSNTGRLEGRLGDGRLEFIVRIPGCETQYRLRWVM